MTSSQRSLFEVTDEDENDFFVASPSGVFQRQRRDTSETEYGMSRSLAKGVIAQERHILSLYIPAFILLDGILVPMNLHDGLASDLIFLLLVLLSIEHDLRIAPSYLVIPLRDLQSKAFHLGKILCWLFLLMFLCVCVSNEFWSPVNVIVEDDKSKTEKIETFQVWEYSYVGFMARRNLYDEERRSEEEKKVDDQVVLANATAAQNFHRYLSSILKDIDPMGIYLIFHMLVGATKFIIARLLIVEAEITVNMLIKFYTTL